MAQKLGETEKEIVAVRLRKLEKMRKMGIDPYPSRSSKTHLVSQAIKEQKRLISSKEKVAVAGRIMSQRGHGQLAFLDLRDVSGKIQIIAKSDSLGGEFGLLPLLDAGDFIEVAGSLFITQSGELTIEAESWKILAKSLRPLPEKRLGLQDEEVRFRKRYLDLLLNPELRDLFIKKEKFWAAMRQFLKDKGFMEVETPVLETTTGGADANPFSTHHDALDIDVYLRISMGELWQKRLMVGGFEKTFEIGRQFRNEGVSREHLQDYTQMEFYWAYANYEDSMKLVKEMYRYVAQKTFKTTKFTIGNFEVDFNDEWGKIDYASTVKEKMGVDVLTASEDEIRAKLRELKVSFNEKEAKGRLIDILWKQIRKEIAGPVFLVNHPVLVSPLAKRKEDNPNLTERYQIILAGSEMGNGYSELNDPQDQAERFQEQAKLRAEGDAEAQMNDEDFVEALEYGMPPTTGFGISERLFSFLANKSAKETQMFPLMRPKSKL